jgi:LmbE family N-acetylglucosaminyl deacetylase
MYAQAAQALDRNNIQQLLGDYWKVTPVKAQARKDITVAPIDNCSLQRQVLTSKAWYNLPKSTPSAYLAVRDPGKTTYQGCTIANLVSRYGTPTERVPLVMNPDAPNTPNALLLLYGQGFKPLTVEKSQAAEPVAEPFKGIAPPGPPQLSPLYKSGICSRGTTLAVVAHQDDDILFMNPDLGSDIADRRCLRTIYMTAGDAGAGEQYWVSREQGAKAAYAQMYGGKENTWRDERQMISGRLVTVSYLQDAPHIALVFLRLPDGNLRGQGFMETGNTSLRALLDGRISAIKSFDAGNEYTKDDLVKTIADIMAADLPDKIYTQGSDDIYDGDHSDHHAAGAYAKLAREQYARDHAISTYLGYPDKSLPVNLTDDQITLKQITFMVYAKFDGAVCQTAFECEQTLTYGSYLTRQYKTTDAPPVPSTPAQTANL